MRFLFALLLSVILSLGIARAGEEYALDSPIAFSGSELVDMMRGKTILKKAEASEFSQLSKNPWIAAALLPTDALGAAGLLMDFQKHPRVWGKMKHVAFSPLGDSRYRVAFHFASALYDLRLTTLWKYHAEKQMAVFRLDPEKPGDFERYQGFWKFIPQKGGKTLALYSIGTRLEESSFEILEDLASRREMRRTVQEFAAGIMNGNYGDR